jgi:hypothetical protein
MPARVDRLGAATVARSAGDLAIVRDGRLEQDARLTRVPNCIEREENVAGDITSLAGRWPDAAYMTRKSEDGDRPGAWVYRWKAGAWALVRRVDDPRAQLLGGSDTVVLARRLGGAHGYQLDALTGKAPAATKASNPACKTELAKLDAAAASAVGEWLAWGTGCDGRATLERFLPGQAPSLTTWDAGTISAGGFSFDGRPLVALAVDAAGPSDVVAARDDEWTSTGRVPGRVRQLVPADGSTFALTEESAGPTLWKLDGSWTQVTVPTDLGSPTALDGSGDHLWVSSDAGLFSTTAPTGGPWEWFRRGCDVDTFSRAKPYKNDPRRRTQNCAGRAFALVGESSDDTPPAGWAALVRALGPAIENGWRQRQGERSQANRPTFGGEPDIAPGFMITPVVSRELQRRYFGFRVVGGRDLVYQAMQSVEGAWKDGPTPDARLRWLCVDPLGYPEAQVRKLGTQ